MPSLWRSAKRSGKERRPAISGKRSSSSARGKAASVAASWATSSDTMWTWGLEPREGWDVAHRAAETTLSWSRPLPPPLTIRTNTVHNRWCFLRRRLNKHAARLASIRRLAVKRKREKGRNRRVRFGLLSKRSKLDIGATPSPKGAAGRGRRAASSVSLLLILGSLLLPAMVAMAADGPIIACCCSRFGHDGPCCCVHGLCVANRNGAAHVRDIVTPPGALSFLETVTGLVAIPRSSKLLPAGTSQWVPKPLAPPPRGPARG